MITIKIKLAEKFITPKVIIPNPLDKKAYIQKALNNVFIMLITD